MKIKLKCKILINGLFPMKNYKIDEFEQKTGRYDEKIISAENENYAFYAGGHLIRSVYSVEGEKGSFYEYFENDKEIGLDIQNELYGDKRKLQEFVLNYMDKKISIIEKRLRLVTGICIGLPIYITNIYDKDNKFIARVGSVSGRTSNLNIASYTNEMKKVLSQRLRFNITAKSLEELEKKNSRYKRALNFYNDSFYVADTGVRFTLLFSSLESLFNLTGNKVKKNIANYASKILFLKESEEVIYKKRLEDYYKIRSYYIHGNNPKTINEEIEFNLREIVRKVLLIYWSISQSTFIKEPKDVLTYLDENDRNTIDLQLQTFIKMLDVKEYSEFYNEVREKLLSGRRNIM